MEDFPVEKPRFKNIGYIPFALKKRDGTIIEIIKPGQIVVGEKYLQFVDAANMQPLKWINKPVVDERKVVIDTRGGK